MLMSVHATVGAVAGTAVGSPNIAFLLGLVSHFFLDMIPHGDDAMIDKYSQGTDTRRIMAYITADGLTTIGLIIFLFLSQDFVAPATVFFGILGALLPDLLVGLSQVIKAKRRWGLGAWLDWMEKVHNKNHNLLLKRLKRWRQDIPLRYGLILQVIALVTMVKLLL